MIVSSVFSNEAGYYLAHHLGAQLVLYFTGQTSLPWIDDAMGQPHNPALLPVPAYDFVHPLDFLQKIQNIVMTFILHYVFR